MEVYGVKLRRVEVESEIVGLMTRTLNCKEVIVWQPSGSSRLLFAVNSVQVVSHAKLIFIKGTFLSEYFDIKSPIYFKFPSRFSVFKSLAASMSAGEIILAFPQELLEEELREIPRISLSSYMTFNNATIVLPGIFIKYSPVTLRVKVVDLNSKGLGLILTTHQSGLIKAGTKVVVDRLGMAKLPSSVLGEVVYVKKTQSGLYQDPELIYRIGVKFVQDLSYQDLDLFMNYIETNEPRN